MNPRLFVSALALVAVTGAGHAADRLHIVDESRLPAKWTPVDALPQSAAYPASLADQSQDACVSLGYLIGEDGRVQPDSLGVLRLWASDGRGTNVEDASLEPFVQAAAATLLQQRFTPAHKKAGSGQEVYTSITLAFVGLQGTPVPAIRNRCNVPNLPSFIAEAQSRDFYKDETFRAQVVRYNQARSATYYSRVSGTNNGSTTVGR